MANENVQKSLHEMNLCDSPRLEFERVPAELIPIHRRMENWAAWSRSRASRRSCLSIEGRYKSPMRGETPDPRISYDLKDAMAINSAMIGLPDLDRIVLHRYYIRKQSQWQISKDLSIPFKDVWDELNRARHMIQNRIGKR